MQSPDASADQFVGSWPTRALPAEQVNVGYQESTLSQSIRPEECARRVQLG